MARRLNTHVVLRENPAVMPVSFGPKDELPDWAAKQLEGADHLFDEPAPVGEVQLPAPKDAKPVSGVVPGQGPLTEPAATELGRAQQVADDDDEDGTDEPPRRNASKPEWAEWAKAHGVSVSDEMGRDDIVKACEDEGLL
jgi:hypothetical protein